MYIWIDQIKYELRCHLREDIRLISTTGQIPVIYAPADCAIERLKQYLQWQPKLSSAPTDEPPLPLVFDRVQIFDQFFPIKLRPQKSYKLVFHQGMIYCDANWYHRTSKDRRKELITETVFEQSVLQLVSRWEEHFQVLAGAIKFRKMTKSYYKTDRESRNIIFNKRNARISLKLNEWVVAKALLQYCDSPEIGNQIIKQQLPNYHELEKNIGYEPGFI